MKELLLGLDLVGTTVNYTFHKVSRYQITIYKYTQFCPVSWSSQGQEKDRELQNLFVKTFITHLKCRHEIYAMNRTLYSM